MRNEAVARIEYPQTLVELLMLMSATEVPQADGYPRLVDEHTIPTALSTPLTAAEWVEVWEDHLAVWPDPPEDPALVSQLLASAGMDRETVVDWLGARAPTKALASVAGRKEWSRAVDLERELASKITIGILPLANHWSQYTERGGLVVSAETRRDPRRYRSVLGRAQ